MRHSPSSAKLPTMTNITQQLSALQSQIHRFETTYHRPIGTVQLLAASKSQSIEKIREAYLAGLRDFGENYLQEALTKIEAAHDLAITWHFIGPIQSNKTRKIAENFAWVHSVDSEKIAKRLNDQRPLTLPALNICIEVNISHENAKSGVAINEVRALAEYCLTLPHLKLRGLMAIPAEYPTFAEQRQAFHQLAELQRDLIQHGIPLDTLSMGMSQDFEAAIAEGATFVRIGTALFGKRT
jgi:pyridoxal phosphate enzyme (YggS family)